MPANRKRRNTLSVDFEAARPMEVEAILGNALKVARRYEISAPYMESLYGLLKLVDNKIRKKKRQKVPPPVSP